MRIIKTFILLLSAQCLAFSADNGLTPFAKDLCDAFAQYYDLESPDIRVTLTSDKDHYFIKLEDRADVLGYTRCYKIIEDNNCRIYLQGECNEMIYTGKRSLPRSKTVPNDSKVHYDWNIWYLRIHKKDLSLCKLFSHSNRIFDADDPAFPIMEEICKNHFGTSAVACKESLDHIYEHMQVGGNCYYELNDYFHYFLQPGFLAECPYVYPSIDLSCIIEPDGSCSHITVERSSGVMLTDSVAVNIVKEALKKGVTPPTRRGINVKYKFDICFLMESEFDVRDNADNDKKDKIEFVPDELRFAKDTR